MSTKTEFLKSLDRSNEVVKSWPTWKQSIWEPLPPLQNRATASKTDRAGDYLTENLHEIKE